MIDDEWVLFMTLPFVLAVSVLICWFGHEAQIEREIEEKCLRSSKDQVEFKACVEQEKFNIKKQEASR